MGSDQLIFIWLDKFYCVFNICKKVYMFKLYLNGILLLDILLIMLVNKVIKCYTEFRLDNLIIVEKFIILK